MVIKADYAPVSHNTYELDDIDQRAADKAERYCVENFEKIRYNPAESATQLFCMLGDVYQSRKVYQRIAHGAELIDVAHIATRTPDMTAIDELFSEYTVYDNSPSQKSAKASTQRVATMFDQHGWRRIILAEDDLRAVDHQGKTLSGDELVDAMMEFAWRTNQAIATYQARTATEQQAANDDAKDKLGALGIYQPRGIS